MESKPSYLQSLGTLQLLAILAVVVGHAGVKDNTFMNSVGVSFCFVYSGFFTARNHLFGSSYSMGDHRCFMQNKLAKLYPLHILAIVLNLAVIGFFHIENRVGATVLLAHLTLLSPWIPNPTYYFGCNHVAWFICALFFLYLIAPLVVKSLRKIPVVCQILLLIALLALEFMIGYTPALHEGRPLVNHYYLYQFPPARLLDFGAGIILCNLSRTAWWKRQVQRLNFNISTLLEVTAIVLFFLFYLLGSRYLHQHCYRAFCASAPAVISLFALFIATSEKPGAISRLLSAKIFPVLCSAGAEIYLLQFFAFFLLRPMFKQLHIYDTPLIYVPILVIALVLFSLLVHRFFTRPLYQLLRPKKRS